MMHRFAHILLFSLAVFQYGAAETNLRTATTPSFASSQQHRDLSASGFWYTLLNLLHVPCPPNHTEEKPLGHCAHPSHTPKAPKKKSGGSSSSSSSTSTSSTVAVAGWSGDSYTASTVKADAWSSGWSNYDQASSEAQNSSSGNGMAGLGIMCAALVGAIAFMVTKTRNQAAGEDSSNGYVEADGIQFSRMASLATSLSRGARSKLVKTNLDNEIGNYDAPV